MRQAEAALSKQQRITQENEKPASAAGRRRKSAPYANV
jgi:hypothetical protein